jgi:hypothetical protein
VVATAALTLAMGTPAGAQDLQQKLAAAKQNAAQNQQALRSYGWIEKVELSLKGEVKNTTVNSCRYDASGKVQKTAVVEPPPPEKKRGLRGKVIEKKKGEMKAELEAATALVHQYVPPDPGMMQVVMNAGTASLAQGGPGLNITLPPACSAKRIRGCGRRERLARSKYYRAFRECSQQLLVHRHELRVEPGRQCNELTVVCRAIAVADQRENSLRVDLELRTRK